MPPLAHPLSRTLPGVLVLTQKDPVRWTGRCRGGRMLIFQTQLVPPRAACPQAGPSSPAPLVLAGFCITAIASLCSGGWNKIIMEALIPSLQRGAPEGSWDQ